MTIRKIFAREILDSRGNPTIEVDITTSNSFARASVPSGASTGIHEAIELRDGGRRYLGLGVKKAVANINRVIAPKLRGKNPKLQEEIDSLMAGMDGTSNKSRIGANAMLAVSIAVCKAAALESNKPLYAYINQVARRKMLLPVPCFNIINGGKHAGNNLDFQEYMLLPLQAKTFSHALQIGSEIYHHLSMILKKRYGRIAVNVGDEGGFAPLLRDYGQPFELILKAAEKAGYNKIGLGIDVAASEFYRKGRYSFSKSKKTPAQMLKIYQRLAEDYPITSIEDPFEQEAFDDFRALKACLPKRVQIVGDDLLATNPARIKRAAEQKSCSALLLKINQIGTISEAIAAAKLAFENSWNVMVSHRSGETTDDFIADLAVGLGTGQLKAGAPCRGERLAKYNQLLRIEEESGISYNRKFFLK